MVISLQPKNATSIKIKWNGSPLFPTKVHYQSYFNETGALITEHTSIIPINVTSLEISVDDSIPGYQHTFSLQYFLQSEVVDNLVTTVSFTFGEFISLIP